MAQAQGAQRPQDLPQLTNWMPGVAGEDVFSGEECDRIIALRESEEMREGKAEGDAGGAREGGEVAPAGEAAGHVGRNGAAGFKASDVWWSTTVAGGSSLLGDPDVRGEPVSHVVDQLSVHRPLPLVRVGVFERGGIPRVDVALPKRAAVRPVP